MIKIIYCGDCGYKLNAVLLKNDIENCFNNNIKIELIQDINDNSLGNFQIIVKNRIIYNKKLDKSWPNNKNIIKKISKILNLKIPFLWRSLEDPPLIHWPKILAYIWILTLFSTCFKIIPFNYILWLSVFEVTLLLILTAT